MLMRLVSPRENEVMLLMLMSRVEYGVQDSGRFLGDTKSSSKRVKLTMIVPNIGLSLTT